MFTKRIIDNLFTMLEYRGYTYVPSSISEDSDEGFDKYDIVQYKIFTTHKGESVVCNFVNIEKLSVDHIRIFVEYLETHSINHGIVICKHEPSPQVLKEISTLQLFFEIFDINKLHINIMKHILVPKHTLLSKREALKIRTDFDAPFSQFPKIKYDDPVARYIGSRVGDLIKVDRHDGSVNFVYVIPSN